MKRKIFSVLFALVLVLSLGLVTAVPVAAEGGSPGAPVFQTLDPGTADWSLDYAKSGNYSVKLYAPAGGGYGMVIMPFDMAFAADLDFSVYLNGGDTAQDLPMLGIRLDPTSVSAGIDLPGEGIDVPSSVTLIQIVSQPLWSTDPVDGTTFKDLQTDNNVDTWELYGTTGTGALPANGAVWNVWWITSGDPPEFEYSYAGAEGTFLTWAEIQTAFGGVATIQDFRVENSYPEAGSTVYVDDILINGVTYELEPRVINIDTDEGFNTIQDAIDDADTAAGDNITVAAGTYAEAVNIYKDGLVVESISGAEVTTIVATSAVATVDFIGPESSLVTGSTLDGFTVINEFMEGPFPVVVRLQEASDCVVTNCVIEGPSIDTVPHMSGFLVSGQYATSDNNTLENSTISNCWNGFVVFGPEADGNIIRNNIIEENSNGGCIEWEASNTLVEHNTIRDNIAGIKFDTLAVVNHNNIYDNTWGVQALEGNTVTLDATNNWWGNASGPERFEPLVTGYESYGDKVSDNVFYEPWLLAVVTEVDPITYDKTLALRNGWTLVSTDQEVGSGTTWVGTDNLSPATILAYKYDADPSSAYYGYTVVDMATQLTPVDAYYVKTDGGGGVGINYSTDAPGVVTKNLVGPGWNLIGCTGANLDEEFPYLSDGYTILSQLRHVQIGEQQGCGLTNLVGQRSYNQFLPYSLSLPLVDEEAWDYIMPFGMGEPIPLNAFDGFWVYMNADKSFGVIPDYPD